MIPCTSYRFVNRFRCLALVWLACTVIVSTAHAATINVDAGAVGVSANGQCSLIEAINNANSDTQADNGDCTGGAGADVIHLPKLSQFTVDNSNFANDTAEQVSGLPSITSDVTIDGNGATIQRSNVAGTNAFRLFRVAATGKLLLDTVTLTNGNLPTGSGGAVLNNGLLEIQASTLSGNVTFGSGGAVHNNSGAGLVVRNSTISGNGTTARGGAGGGIASAGTAELYNVTLAENGSDNGANLFNSGTMSLGNTIISSPNVSADDCSGNFVSLGHNIDTDNTCGLVQITDHPASDAGIAILTLNGGPTRTHPLFGDSIAVGAGSSDLCNIADPKGRDQRGYPRGVKTLGGVIDPDPGNCDIGAFEYGGSMIFVDESSPGIGEVGKNPRNFLCSLIEAIENANADSPSPGGGDCEGGSGLGKDLIVLPDNATFTLTNDNFANVPLADGGLTGLPNITTGMLIDGNGSTIGRSQADGTSAFRLMHVINGGSLEITDVTLTGGYVSDPGFQDSGGAILVQGTLFIEFSTIANNRADQAGGGLTNSFGNMQIYRSSFLDNVAWLGGAVEAFGGLTFIVSSTFSGNATTAGGQGGAMHVGAADGFFRLHSLTVTNNSSANGGGIYFGGNDPRLVNVILADQGAGGNCTGPASIVSNGGNLSDDDSCPQFTSGLDQTGFSVNADLGPLADNGGPTLTHALGPDSDAIDRGNGLSCDFIVVGGIDQRNGPRGIDYDGTPNSPAFGDCDSGAVEMRPILIFADSFE